MTRSAALLLSLLAAGAVLAQTPRPRTPRGVRPSPAARARTTPRPVGAPVAAETIATERIKDLKAVLRINHDETNYDELKKIGGAFATTYRVPRYDVFYKWPNRARFEARILGASAVMVYNGDRKMFRIPLRTEVKDVHGQPGQKQSLMDMGLFARDWLTTDYQANFLRREGGLIVYKLSQRNTDNRSHEIVWVNPKTAITERRLSYNGDNVLQKEVRYVRPREIAAGIFVASRIEIYNQFGKLGAVQDIEEVTVNAGLGDDLFAIS